MKTTIIAEIGSNWEGNLTKAKKIIFECKKVGVDIVKFQMWRAHDLYSPDHPNWKKIKKSELTFEKAKLVKRFSDKIGIEFVCSAFYPEAVDFLESLKVKRYKIASRTCLLKDPFSKETLEAVAGTNKPVIVSMGMGGNKNLIHKIFSRDKTTYCYCISEYPLKFSKINWKNAVKFNGFSDHTMGITSPILYIILKNLQGTKRIVIEKHVKLKNSKGPDASTSIVIEQLADFISHARILEKAKLS